VHLKGLSSCRLLAEGRALVVANFRVVCAQLSDELKFHSGDFGSIGRLRVPKYVSRYREALSLFFREVLGYQLVGSATKVVDAIGSILPDIDLAVGIGDPIDDAWHDIRLGAISLLCGLTFEVRRALQRSV
jgi:hypothetical protein